MTGIAPGAGEFHDGKPLGSPMSRLCSLCKRARGAVTYQSADGYTRVRYVCPKCDKPEADDATTEEADPRRLQ